MTENPDLLKRGKRTFRWNENSFNSQGVVISSKYVVFSMYSLLGRNRKEAGLRGKENEFNVMGMVGDQCLIYVFICIILRVDSVSFWAK